VRDIAKVDIGKELSNPDTLALSPIHTSNHHAGYFKLLQFEGQN